MLLIPESARPGDLQWDIAYLSLAHGLVMAGAKSSIIERFTYLSHRKVRKLYHALRCTAPPAGAIVQGSARYFAKPSKHRPIEWSIQCAIFLACYEHMARTTSVPAQRGWLLLAAFNAYLSLTESLHDATSVKRLDINQAYALLACCGFMTMSSGVKLQRRHCLACSLNYLVVVGEDPDTQTCPVCKINATCARGPAKNCQSKADTVPETQ